MFIEDDNFDYRASPYVTELKPRELRGSLAIFTLLNSIYRVAKGNA